MQNKWLEQKTSSFDTARFDVASIHYEVKVSTSDFEKKDMLTPSRQLRTRLGLIGT
jgi:hypothetical protein